MAGRVPEASDTSGNGRSRTYQTSAALCLLLRSGSAPTVAAATRRALAAIHQIGLSLQNEEVFHTPLGRD
jgi:hypothetical protein